MATTIEPGPSEGKEKMRQLTNKKYKLDIYADDGSGQLQFWLQAGDNETLKHIKGGRLKFDWGNDWYDIEYSLDDSDSSVKVKFKDSQPICVQSGTGCPGKNSGISANGQISVEDIKDKKLVIQNKNQNQEIFSYNLFFTDLSGNDIGELDPIYDNGGGGHN
jgi:hypothetical protein